jgi:ADP-heptose:LPS heptosyltransferase
MEPLTIVRIGGFGDHIFMSATFPFLLEKHPHVHLEVNTKGMDIFLNDPRFDYVSVCDFGAFDHVNQEIEYKKRWARIEEDCKRNGRRYLNFWNSIENSCILPEFNAEVMSLSLKEKAAKYSSNYYEKTFEAAEVKMPLGWMHENTIYYSDPEIGVIERWHKRTEDSFKLMVALGGSSRQKVFTWMPSFCRRLVDIYPKLNIYLMGGSELANDVWEYERTFSFVNGTSSVNVNYRQAILMTKYSDFFLGGETGLLTAAGMMATPKVGLFTISEIDQIAKYHINDYSVQSKADCSPCHVMAYSGTICEREKKYNAFPKCIDEFDLDEIQNIIDKHYCEKF